MAAQTRSATSNGVGRSMRPDIEGDEGAAGFFKSSDEFWEVFNKFNCLNGDWERWETPVARKQHCDLFGDTVDIGEVYFKKQVGQAFDQVVKVSIRSMAKILYVALLQSGRLMQLASQCADDDWQRMVQMANRRGSLNKGD